MLRNPPILAPPRPSGRATRIGNRAEEREKNKKNGKNNTDSGSKTYTGSMSQPVFIRPPPALPETGSPSLRELLNDSRDVMDNLQALFGLLDGKKRAGVPDEFPEYFNMVFDRSCCTSLTQSIRYPSCEGLEEMDHDDLYIDFVLNFQSSFKASVKEVVLFRPPQVIKYTIRLVNEDTDVTFTSIAYIGGSHGKIIRIERQETHYSIYPLINNLHHYFALYSGEMLLTDQASRQELRTRFNAIYHQSLTVTEETSIETTISTTSALPSQVLSTTARTIEYDEVYSSAARLSENGAKIDLLYVHIHQDGLQYGIRLSLAGDIHLLVVRCLASVENGRIVRITSCPDTSCTSGIGLRCATEKGFFPLDIQAMSNVKNLMALFQGKNKTPYDFPRQFACTFEKSVEFIRADTSPVATNALPSSFDDLHYEFLQFAILRKKVDITSIERVSKRVIAFTIHAYNQESDSTTSFVANVARSGKFERLVQQGETKYSIFPLIKSFRVFMALFDETQNQRHALGQNRDQDSVLEERLNAICDPSIAIETSRGCVGYEQILKTVLPSWLEKGRKTTVLQLKRHESGLEYTLRHSTATHEVTIRSIALVERGKIVRVVPKRENESGNDECIHNQDYEFVYHNARPINSITMQDRNIVFQKMKVYFDLFRHQAGDGGVHDESKRERKSKRRLLAAMVDLFDPLCFELTTTNGPVDYEWFKKCELQKIVRGSNIALRVINAHHPKGICYEELHFLDDGSDETQKVVRIMAILRGGKIVRLEAIENAEYYNLLYPQSRPCLV